MIIFDWLKTLNEEQMASVLAGVAERTVAIFDPPHDEDREAAIFDGMVKWLRQEL